MHEFNQIRCNICTPTLAAIPPMMHWASVRLVVAKSRKCIMWWIYILKGCAYSFMRAISKKCQRSLAGFAFQTVIIVFFFPTGTSRPCSCLKNIIGRLVVLVVRMNVHCNLWHQSTRILRKYRMGGEFDVETMSKSFLGNDIYGIDRWVDFFNFIFDHYKKQVLIKEIINLWDGVGWGGGIRHHTCEGTLNSG